MNDNGPAEQRPRPGFLRRVINTPLRDLLRFRLTGRLDVREPLEEADLPPSLRAVVLDVVRRSRLWRLERADVARELAAHFADGLEARESSEALEAAFGPRRRAARLIRRARRRGRPLGWRVARRAGIVTAIVLALLVTVYAGATARLFMGEPSVEHDYLAEANAEALAVPDDARAWPLYEQAHDRLGPADLPADWRNLRPGDDDWPALEAFLDERASAVALLRRAADRPGLGYVLGGGAAGGDPEEAPALFRTTDELIPYLSKLRHLALILDRDAYRAAARGDGARATDDVRAMLGMALHARELPFLLNGMVGLAVIERAAGTTGAILAHHAEALSDGELEALAHHFAGLDGAGALRPSLHGEHLIWRDLIQRLYTDDGTGEGHLSAEGLARHFGGGPLAPAVGLVSAGRRAMRREVDRWFDRLEGEFAKPLWRQDVARLDREAEQRRESLLYSVRYPLLPLVVPALAKAGREPELVTQQRDALLAAIALELHRRRTGRWPAALSELVPELLPAVPRDRFDGAALRYRIVDGRPLLYSVGADGDDDAGRATLDPGGRPEPRLAALVSGDPGSAADGDWVLWPARPEEAPPRRDSRAERGAGEPSPG